MEDEKDCTRCSKDHCLRRPVMMMEASVSAHERMHFHACEEHSAGLEEVGQIYLEKYGANIIITRSN